MPDNELKQAESALDALSGDVGRTNYVCSSCHVTQFLWGRVGGHPYCPICGAIHLSYVVSKSPYTGDFIANLRYDH